MLGVQSPLGRLFSAGDDKPQAVRTAVLSHETWNSAFGGDAGVLGKTITIREARGIHQYVVIGVLRPSFEFADYGPEPNPTPDIWVPSWISDQPDDDFGGLFATLKKGVSVTDAEREIQSIFDATLSNNLRPFFGTVGARISPRQTEQAADIRTSLYVLLGSSGLLLLIACGNVAAARRCPVRFAPKPFVDGRGNRDRNWSSYREWPLTRGIAVRSQHDRRRDLRWNNNGASRWRDSRRIPSGTPRCPMRSHDRSARGLVRRDGIEIGLGLWRHQVLRSGPAMFPSACYVNLR